jgi:hypothetical protein
LPHPRPSGLRSGRAGGRSPRPPLGAARHALSPEEEGLVEGDPILSGLATCDIFVDAVEEGGASVLTVAGSLHEHSSSFLVSLPLPGAVGETPFRRADANGDEAVDLSDAVFVLPYLFLGGPALPVPYPGCGLDPTEDGLGCRVSPCWR